MASFRRSVKVFLMHNLNLFPHPFLDFIHHQYDEPITIMITAILERLSLTKQTDIIVTLLLGDVSIDIKGIDID
jgi:hypothetical protein